MTKYYKIVTEKSYFKRICGIDDISAIPNGTKFTASAPVENDKVKKNLYINKPVFHFCDNAFDIMLWHNIFERLYQSSDAKQTPVIYEIIPLSEVVKEKCSDKLELYQCGATKIEIKTKMSLNRMFDRAVKEFKNNKAQKEELYPNLPLSKIIDAWKRHQQALIIH